jgi:hypothetical protein
MLKTRKRLMAPYMDKTITFTEATKLKLYNARREGQKVKIKKKGYT